jgi:hypothetical protein
MANTISSLKGLRLGLASSSAQPNNSSPMPQSLSAVYIHLVFSTKDRRHRKMDFKEELRALLPKHQLEWDERYVWD